ncbi:MAG: hypothetical protein CMI00_03565 [Oceanospirillaceae bacterium]|nr:hypothetical protein [Oceanospirillaceae bacterium]|tara:strand:+ start:1330 stop:1959 length:630 start_codon:yes stop_codon:yes gene_type:complete
MISAELCLAFTTKEMISALAMALTFIAFFPYIRSVLKGRVRPHMFSWLIWGLATGSVFFAQLADGAGAGAWPIGFSGMLTFLIGGLAWLKRADVTITRSDWVFFITALAALPIWYLTSDPLWAVIILTGIDLLAYGPMLRKTWHQPWSESLTFMLLFGMRNYLVLFALEHYSLTTVLFPAATAVALSATVAMIVWRRNRLSSTQSGSHT